MVVAVKISVYVEKVSVVVFWDGVVTPKPIVKLVKVVNLNLVIASRMLKNTKKKIFPKMADVVKALVVVEKVLVVAD